jgi:hypothetical protein
MASCVKPSIHRVFDLQIMEVQRQLPHASRIHSIHPTWMMIQE